MIRLPHLDMLRALLALMVVMGHARMLLWMPWREWSAEPHPWGQMLLAYATSLFRYGHEAVMVFFALSGFFVHLRAAQRFAQTGQVEFDLRDYARRRAKRLLPPYYVALAFTCLIDAFGHHWFPRLYLAQTGAEIIDTSFATTGYTLKAVIPALLAQPGLLNMRFGGNAPLWSIGHEVFYYAIYPLFMLVWSRSRVLAYLLGTAAGCACYLYPIAGWWSKMLLSYPVWLSGAALAELTCRYRFASAQRAWPVAATCGIVGLLAALIVHDRPEADPAYLPLCMIMGTTLIMALAAVPVDLTSLRTGRLLEWLGTRSYSLYIFHFPVIVFFAAWCFQTWGERPAHGWLALAGGTSSLVAGLLGFYLAERHFLPRRQTH